MQVALDSFEVIEAMAKIGLPASVSDAGVAALAARTAVMGAFLNVRINAKGVEDKAWIAEVLARGEKMQAEANARESTVVQAVVAKL